MDLLGDERLLRIGGKKTTDPKAAIEEERQRWREAPPTNAALDAWAKDLRPAKKGGCHVCARDARGTCGSCERPVCSSHSWVMLGVCRECATEDRMASWNKERSAGKNWLDEV